MKKNLEQGRFQANGVTYVYISSVFQSSTYHRCLHLYSYNCTVYFSYHFPCNVTKVLTSDISSYSWLNPLLTGLDGLS